MKTIYVVKSLLLFITYFFLYLTVRKINGKKNKIKPLSIIIIINMCVCNALSSTLSNDMFKGIITYTSMCIFAFEVNKEFNNTILIDGFISYVHIAVGETLLALIMVFLGFSDFMTNYNNMSLYKLIYSSVNSVVIYSLIVIPIWKKFLQNLRNVLINSRVFVLLITFVLLVCEVSTILTIMNTKNNKDVFLSFLLLVLMAICVSDLLYNIRKKQELKLINNNLLIKSDSLFKVLNNYKMFKHNMKHELMAISAIGDNKVKGLINNYLEEYNDSKICNISEISNIPDGFKSLIYQKILESTELNININVDNLLKFDPFEKLSVKKICKLSQCIGIAFDNALEASSKCNDGFIYMKFEQIDNDMLITFENNFNDTIDIDDILTPGVSSKKGHMGIGTSYLLNQNMIKTKILIRNNIFILKISIQI